MTAVQKIDSNFTELRYAQETSVGVLPGTPVWVQLDPNSYDSFGGKIKTVARNPINSSRQRKKGVVVDLDASGGFTIDMTQDNIQPLMQGFLFADMRVKDELTLAQVDGTLNGYLPTTGGAGYSAGDLLFAKGAVNASNNGLKVVTGTPSTSQVLVTDASLVDENGSTIVISRVGKEFASGVATIDASGVLPKLHISGNVAGTGTLTFAGQPANNDTVTIGTQTYTFKTTLTPLANEVKIAASTALSIVNLQNAVNRNGLGVPDTDFAASTVANAVATVSSVTATTAVFTAIVKGTAGNSIATTEVGANTSFGTATLTGGLGKSFLSYGLTVGEWVCIGDDTAGFQFATAANNGLKRVRVIGNDDLTFDKSTLQMVTDAGTGKTIHLIFGRLVKNEAGSLVKRRSYQLERSLGAPDDASPSQIQYEYLTGSIPDKVEISVKQGDKITAKMNFMARDHQTFTGVQGPKAGTRPVLADADAFNATSHVIRLSMAVIDQTTANPTDLFAFLTDLNLSVDNQLKANKAIKVLGAFDNTAGTLNVDANATAYFSNVLGIQAVRNNSDVTMDMTFGQHNKGITIDMPLLSVGDALAQVKQDEPIMLPIANAAATGAKIDTNLNHTLLFMFWDYLPTLAA